MRGMLLATLVVLALLAPTVAAHATPRTFEPASGARIDTPPTELRVEFTEALDPAATTLTLVDAEGAAVPLGPLDVDGARLRATIDAPLGAGGHLARWSTISSVDGHKTQGSWSFVVGQGALLEADDATSSSFRLDAVAGKLLAYVGYALALGAGAYALAVRGDPRLPRIATAGALVALGGSLLFAASQIAVSGLGARGYLLGTSFGRGVLLRVALAAALVGAATAWRRHAAGAWFVGALVLASVAVASGFSHSAAFYAPAWVGITISAAHYASILLWAGALAVLMLDIARMPRDGSAAAQAHAAAARFGRLATLGVVLVVLTGIPMFLLYQGLDWRAWTRSDYAGVLVLHTLGGGAMVAMGGLNRWRRVPALLREAADALGALRVSVQHEAIVALVVVGLAAGLTNLQPTPLVAADDTSSLEEPARPVFETLTGEVHGYHLTIDPGPALGRESNLTVHLYENATRRQVDDAYAVLVRVRHVETDTSGDYVQLEPKGDGLYATRGAFFALRGNYELEIAVQTPRVFSESVFLTLRPA